MTAAPGRSRDGLDPAALQALAHGLPPSRLWSQLMAVFAQRAAARRPVDLMRQWRGDRFVAPAPVGQRTLMAFDQVLFDAAAAFEALELSPLAPLGSCTAVAPVSQNRIVSALRGTEVCADPANVLALECAARLGDDPSSTVRLATSQRVVRAQAVPPRRGYVAHFRLFCLASAAHERADQAFAVEALVEHVGLHLGALDALQSRLGCALGSRCLRLVASAAQRHVAQRVHDAIGAARPTLAVEHASLDGHYYDGLRFMIDVEDAAGQRILLADGGRFDWLHRLAGHARLTLVCSALGSQLAAALFPPAATR